MVQRDGHKSALLFLCIFLFLAFVMWCTPYSSDDYEFAAMTFEDAGDFFSYILHYGNGRILGNVFSIGLVQLPSLAVWVKAFVTVCVIFLLPAVLKLNSISCYLGSFILLMAVKPEMFGEVYTWTCGFSNYLIPVWLTLLVLYLLQRWPEIRNPAIKPALPFLVFLLGAASQLFVEHATVIHVLMAMVLTLFCIRKKKDTVLPCAAWLAGTLAGAALMFLVPVLFHTAGNRSEGYRSVNLGGLYTMVYSAIRNFLRLGNHYMGATVVPVCLGSLITTFLTRKRRASFWNRLLYTGVLLVLGYGLFNTLLVPNSWYGRQTMVYHGISAVMGLLPFALWFLSALFLEDRTFRWTILGLLCFSIISWGMFLIVSPTPVRVIYQSYLFAVAALMLCLRKLVSGIDGRILCAVKDALPVLVCTLVLVLGLIFFNGRKMGLDRENHILKEMSWGSTSIEVFEIPYQHIFWDSDWCLPRYYYHNEPGDIHFITIDYYTWANRYAGGY